MRTRNEINEEMLEDIEDDDLGINFQLLMEVLLDNRDIMSEIRDEINLLLVNSDRSTRLM